MVTEGLHRSLVAPWEACEAVRRELLVILDAAGPSRWRTQPTDGGWTVAQQVDHLLRAEVGTSKMAHKLLRGDFSNLRRSRESPLHTSALDTYPYGRLPAPAGLEPGDLPFAETKERLAAVHQRFFEELRHFQGPDPDALAAPDPSTGVWFTLGGWVRLQALHEAHHIRQIKQLWEG